MRFKYLRDPLFLACVAIYLANRLLLKPLCPLPFLRCYLNDAICIPFWVPILLYLMRKLRLRRHDLPPAAREILVPLIVWSFVFEIWLPATRLFNGRAIADHWDVLAYAVGALVASVIWRLCYPTAAESTPPSGH